MSRPIRSFLFAGVLVLLPTTAVFSQGFTWPEPANLQVMPSDVETDQLRSVMFGFTRSLGVRCSHCHVGEEGQPLSEYDFASDERELKRVTRVMMRMTQAINADYIASLERPEALQVTCETCHRGNARPTKLQDELFVAYADGGLDASFARYRALLERFGGGFTFDFRPASLDAFAGLLLEQGHTADAIAFYRFNLAEHPDWANGHVGLGHALLAGGDAAGARAEFETALSMDPENRLAQRALSQLDSNN